MDSLFPGKHCWNNQKGAVLLGIKDEGLFPPFHLWSLFYSRKLKLTNVRGLTPWLHSSPGGQAQLKARARKRSRDRFLSRVGSLAFIYFICDRNTFPPPDSQGLSLRRTDSGEALAPVAGRYFGCCESYSEGYKRILGKQRGLVTRTRFKGRGHLPSGVFRTAGSWPLGARLRTRVGFLNPPCSGLGSLWG